MTAAKVSFTFSHVRSEHQLSLDNSSSHGSFFNTGDAWWGKVCFSHGERQSVQGISKTQFLFSLYLTQFFLKAWTEALARSTALRRNKTFCNSLGKLEVTVLNINTNHFTSTEVWKSYCKSKHWISIVYEAFSGSENLDQQTPTRIFFSPSSYMF